MLAILAGGVAGAQDDPIRISGTILDPIGLSVAGAHIEADASSGARLTTISGGDGGFALSLPAAGAYTVRVQATGFATLARTMQLSTRSANLTLRLDKVSATSEEVVVTADVSQIDIAAPDPSQRILVREELLDANPGRPGATYLHPRSPD